MNDNHFYITKAYIQLREPFLAYIKYRLKAKDIEASDILHDAFLRCLTFTGQLKSVEDARALIYVFMKYRLITYWRKGVIHQRYIDCVSASIIDAHDSVKITAKIDSYPMVNIYVKRIENLSNMQRQVVKRYLVDDMSIREIADESGQSYNTVNNCFSKARKNILQGNVTPKLQGPEYFLKRFKKAAL